MEREQLEVADAGPAARPLPIHVRSVPFDAPWSWLARGWSDLWTLPHVSMTCGAIFSLIAAAFVYGLTVRGLEAVMLALAGGFMLVGPMAAVTFYETSRRLEEQAPVTPAALARSIATAPGQLGFFGAILSFAYVVWLQLALLLFMLFFGGRPFPPASEFVPTLLFTSHGLGLLVTGSIVGGIVAGIVFMISVVSVPLLMTERIDAVTAIRTSVRAVLSNPKPMLLWAGLIAGLMSLGLATMFVGLAIAFPLVGHATWHAFCDLVSRESESYL